MRLYHTNRRNAEKVYPLSFNSLGNTLLLAFGEHDLRGHAFVVAKNLHLDLIARFVGLERIRKIIEILNLIRPEPNQDVPALQSGLSRGRSRCDIGKTDPPRRFGEIRHTAEQGSITAAD